MQVKYSNTFLQVTGSKMSGFIYLNQTLEQGSIHGLNLGGPKFSQMYPKFLYAQNIVKNNNRIIIIIDVHYNQPKIQWF